MTTTPSAYRSFGRSASPDASASGRWHLQHFDELAETHGVEKIKTIGDATWSHPDCLTRVPRMSTSHIRPTYHGPIGSTGCQTRYLSSGAEH